MLMAQLRAKGRQCYGIGAMTEDAIHKFVRFHLGIVVSLAKSR